MRQLLASGAKELGITLSERQLDAFDAFTALMLDWNRKLNLTRITDPEEIAVKHYLDSLVLLAKVEVPEGSSVIDIGTGAGFPGIPLKIARPDLRLTLLDSVRKRLTFLEAAVRELSLSDVEIVHSRAEDAAREKHLRERFDFATARAVAGLNVLAELCLPFCRVGGRFAAYKGPEIGTEVEAASKAIRLLGGKVEAVHEFDLPLGGIRRSLVIISKVKATPAGYPRKAGIPERNPL